MFLFFVNDKCHNVVVWKKIVLIKTTCFTYLMGTISMETFSRSRKTDALSTLGGEEKILCSFSTSGVVRETSQVKEVSKVP